MSLLYTILNILFPVNCLSCGKRGSSLCLKCLSLAPRAERECPRWIHPLYDYRYPAIKKSIWLLKYKNRKILAHTFAESIYGHLLEEISDLVLMENFQKPALIPIPLSKSRMRERGFNQAELICSNIIKLDEGKNLTLLKNVLIKNKETQHQARIENRRERLKNIVGSFSLVNEESVKNRNIILIDDVITTGATLSEAKKILKNSGARKIIAFTIAH